MPTNPLDLCSYLDVKAWLATQQEASIPRSEDPVLMRAVTAASLHVLRYCGRDSLNSTPQYTEVWDGTGSNRLFTRNFPIRTVVAISDGARLLQPSLGFGQPGYFIEEGGRSIAFRSGSGLGNSSYSSNFFGGCGYGFSKGIGNIQIIYTAGYPAIPVIAEPFTVPASPAPNGYYVAVDQGPWQSDQGVAVSGGGALALVTGPPAAGQYSVVNGLYLFNAAQAAVVVLLSYTIGGAPSDLQEAVVQLVGETIRKRQWIGIKSKMLPESGTTSYRDWFMSPDVKAKLEFYRRYAH